MKDGVTVASAGTDALLVTDGARVYFTEGTANLSNLAQVSSAGGETAIIPTSIGVPQLLDISPDRSTLLVAGFSTNHVGAAPLWSVPVPAGTPYPLANLSAWDAHFSGRP